MAANTPVSDGDLATADTGVGIDAHRTEPVRERLPEDGREALVGTRSSLAHGRDPGLLALCGVAALLAAGGITWKIARRGSDTEQDFGHRHLAERHVAEATIDLPVADPTAIAHAVPDAGATGDETAEMAEPDFLDGPCLDEIGCLLADDPPRCCKRYGRRREMASDRRRTKPPDRAPSEPPDRLQNRRDRLAGMRQVRSNVAACGKKHPGKGQVPVTITVAPSGSVARVKLERSPNRKLGRCVAREVEKARFIRTQQGGSFSYPFLFR